MKDKNDYVKGTLSLISSDPPWKEGMQKVTTVPFKPLTDQSWKDNFMSFDLKTEFKYRLGYLNLPWSVDGLKGIVVNWTRPSTNWIT